MGIRTAVLFFIVMFGLTEAAQSQTVPMRVVKAAPDGNARYVAPSGQPVALRGVTPTTLPTVAARVALREYAASFGINDPDQQLQELRTFTFASGGHAVRYRQLQSGIPVIAGELVVGLTAERRFASLSGETSAQKVSDVTATISSAQAQRIAGIAVAKYRRTPIVSLITSEPELSVYDPQLFGPKTSAQASLVWRMEVTAVDNTAQPVRQFVLIDAQTGAMALNFDQVETARNRLTYTANGTSGLQTQLVCNESQPDCTNGLNPDADAAHRYGADMYNFFFTRFGRDSYNNLGASLVQTVNSTYTGCPNAAWLGTQMVYCPGAPVADDVVGHELTHGVTQYTSGLLYYYESGAINESLSDVFGELLDLSNSGGTDTPATRWLMGEDFTGVGAIRNLINPPQFSDPDRMTSPLYWRTTGDSGGVHTNSGVNNKAAALLVDGGAFNGFNITGLGIDKVARLYYNVETLHLTSGSGYADLYTALRQACQNLIGQSGFTADDCVQVVNVTNATEMNMEPVSGFNPDARVCAPGFLANNLFFDDAEGSSTAWGVGATVGVNGWSVTSGYATSGIRSYAITSSLTTVSDSTLSLLNGITLPANAFLHFRHSFDYEFSGTSYHDGGVVEYSTDNGVTWADIRTLYDSGQNYVGPLATGSGNPLAGRQAFAAQSHGFVSTRYNLASLAGSTVRIRFRNATDSSIASPSNPRTRAWAIDDVRIYTCVADTSPNSPPVASAGADRTVSPGRPIVLSAAGSTDSDGEIISVQWSQISGPSVSISNPNLWTVNLTAPGTAVRDTMVFRVRVMDNRGVTSTDDVQVEIVNQQPIVNGGADRTVRPNTAVNIAAIASDPDGAVVSYAWTQISGPTVTLTGVSTSTLSIVTPPTATSQTLVFRVRVLDNYGGSGTDDITVTALNQQPIVTAGADTDTKPRLTTTLSAAYSDPDGVVSNIAWTQVSGPTVALLNSNSIAPSFTAPSVPTTAIVVLRATVTDNDTATTSDDVSISIINSQPTASAGADRSAGPGENVSIIGSGVDTDGTVAAHMWTQVSGPTVTLQNPDSNTVSFIAPSLSYASSVTLRLTVTDNDGGTGTDDLLVSVAAVPQPQSGGGGGALDGWYIATLLLLFGVGRRRLLSR